MATDLGLPRSLDPSLLPAAIDDFAHWFRYPLHAGDFHPLRDRHRLLGYYAGKPLYGRLDAHGRVDRSQGFSGDLVAVFVPSPARSWRQAELVFAHMPAAEVERAGKRNWPAINAVLAQALRRHLDAPTPID
ncbi:MAG: hypothetical protein JSS25_01645 [Proteobacteria bacterium]|nr:hypothetical protein [Pseudomonadota bacterium]